MSKNIIGFSVDLRSPQVSIEELLITLELHLDHLDESINYIVEQYKIRQIARFNSSGLANDKHEREVLLADLKDFEEFVIPRAILNPIVPMIWATYESGIQDIAKCIRQLKAVASKENIKSFQKYYNRPEDHQKFQNVFGLERTWNNRIRVYFDKILKEPLAVTEEEWSYMDCFYDLRNIMAHNNGNLAWSENRKTQQIDYKWSIWIDHQTSNESRNPKEGVIVLHDNYVLATKGLLHNLYKQVSKILISAFEVLQNIDDELWDKAFSETQPQLTKMATEAHSRAG